MDKTIKKATQIATDHGALKQILNKIERINCLNKFFLKYIDANLQDYCQVVNELNGKLIVLVANGSVATQLRFSTMDLLRKFKQDPQLQHVKEIHIKVRPFDLSNKQIRQHKSVQKMSAQTAKILEEMAESLEDEKLKEIMKNIAKNVE